MDDLNGQVAVVTSNLMGTSAEERFHAMLEDFDFAADGSADAADRVRSQRNEES